MVEWIVKGLWRVKVWAWVAKRAMNFCELALRQMGKANDKCVMTPKRSKGETVEEFNEGIRKMIEECALIAAKEKTRP